MTSATRQNRTGTVHFKVADAMQLPFTDNTFDAVVSQAFFILIDNRERALREMMQFSSSDFHQGFFPSMRPSPL